MRRRLLPTLALLVATAACGSTVQVTSSGADAQLGADPLGSGTAATATGSPQAEVPTALSSAPGVVVPGSPSGGTGAGTTGSTGAGTTSGSTGLPSTPATQGAIPEKGRGWDKSTVYVGVIMSSDAGAGLSALGVSINPGDMKGDVQAVVGDLNRKGGLFGRRVVAVIKDDSSASAVANPSAVGAADCAYFSDDRPVISVLNTNAGLDVDSFRACFKKAGIPVTSVTTAAFDDHDMSTYSPFFYNALSISWDRLATPFVARLKALGYFGGWNTTTGSASPTAPVKVGVYYGGTGSSKRSGDRILAALQKAGYATDSYRYNDPSSDAQSAVLRFASDRVTHVIGIGSLFYFSIPAKTQGYYPRFGVTTYEGLQALLVSNGAKGQLRGAMGVGWYPTLDTEATEDPGPGPGSRDCLTALQKGGQTFAGKRFAQAYGMAVCDGIRLPVLAAKQAGGLDPATIRSGIVGLGGRFPTGGSFASGLSATNSALPGAARDIVWDGKAFRYQGPLYRIG